MGQMNISREEKAALASIDLDELRRLVDKAVRDEGSAPLIQFHLENCGPYVCGQLRDFQRALMDLHKAKSGRKQAEMSERVSRAGGYVFNAVMQMRSRLAQEEEEGKLFYVEDHIMPPSYYSPQMSVRVHYHWRKQPDEQWNFGTIEFQHHEVSRPDYSIPATKRKPSAAKQQEALQARLYDVWDHLMKTALYSVRDYFRDGGDGAKIPEKFKVQTDAYSGSLNNHSAKFWLPPP